MIEIYILLSYFLFGLILPTLIQLTAIYILKNEKYCVTELFEIKGCGHLFLFHILSMFLWGCVALVFIITKIMDIYDGSVFQRNCKKVFNFWKGGFKISKCQNSTKD